MNKYIEYARAFTASEEVVYWVSHNLANHLKDNPEVQDEIEHIIDYFASDAAPKRLRGMSYAEAKANTEKWNATLQKKGANIKEKPEDTETVLDFKDGFRVVKLIGKVAFEREGFLMRHCSASYFNKKDTEVYSLRDSENMPHCTMEKNKQVKGKGNGNIHPKYVGYVVKFLEHIGMAVGDNEMEHLGYINVEKFKKDLHKDTDYFNEKYVREDTKLLDKDGNEYLSLDLLDVKPLLKEDEHNVLRINFDLAALCKLSFEWIQKKIKKVQSGNSSRQAQSGNYSHQAQSGDSSRQAQSGDSSHQAQSGNYSHQAQSGDSSRQAQSGNSSRQAQSGNSSHQAQSGDSSRQAQSGNYSQQEMNGLYSVSVNAGDDGMIKGKIGCWFALTEWFQDTDKNWKPKCVKATKIDGKKIKEDTWYTLKNGKFVEVKDNE